MKNVLIKLGATERGEKSYHFTDGKDMLSGKLTFKQMQLVRDTMLQVGIHVDDRSSDKPVIFNIFVKRYARFVLIGSCDLDTAKQIHGDTILGIDYQTERGEKSYYFTDGKDMLSGKLTFKQMQLVRDTMLQVGLGIDYQKYRIILDPNTTPYGK